MATAKITNPALLGLKHALTLHTGRGDFTVDPAEDPLGYEQLLQESSDERERQANADEDS